MQELYRQAPAATAEGRSVEVGKVLRNTYMLLALTFTFSTITAGVAMAMNVPPLGLWMLLPYFVLLFLVEKFKNSVAGLFLVFALTGWLGFSLGPIIKIVAANAGFEPILMALGGTALIFFSVSAYVLITGKDLSFMGRFVLIGILVAFIAGIANVFFDIQGLGLAVSTMFLFLSSCLIAWYTSAIIHGGETNYITATVILFVAIYNIFTSLLHLITAFSGND